MQFPVSSGQHHRLNESEWVPVVPPKKSSTINKGNPARPSPRSVRNFFFVNTEPLTGQQKPDLATSFRPASETIVAAVATIPPLMPPPQPPTFPSGTMQQYTADGTTAARNPFAVAPRVGIPPLMAAPVNPPSPYVEPAPTQSIFQDSSQGSVNIVGSSIMWFY